MNEIDGDSNINEQFGFYEFYGMELEDGWLFNYHIARKDDKLETHLYFIKKDGESFKMTIPFHPSFLISTTDNHSVTEYIHKRYAKSIHKVQEIEKYDVNEHNHLNKPPKKFLKVYFNNESVLISLMKEIKSMLHSRKNRNAEVFEDKLVELESFGFITGIYETDIPYEIQTAVELKITCGTWHKVSYNGTDYEIYKTPENVEYPKPRIFAFDIETSKDPLKFPKPEKDKVMMISIMNEQKGHLIINREIVSESIEKFSYSPKPEIEADFEVHNESDEKSLLEKFIKIVKNHKPHIFVTFNGAFFDFPFLEKRMELHNLCMWNLIGIKKEDDFYNGEFCIHLDCYKWVKRDSYLPASSQGLKAATRAKLGYEPDEIDPEDMMRCAQEEPQKMASYSVSDAVATYFLYIQYVHQHIFSMSSIIPLPPTKVLCKGSGTLCESLLISQAEKFNILIPSGQKQDNLQFYNGHIVDNLTYVGGHVESLKAGIFRTDFLHKFNIDQNVVTMITENIDVMLSEYADLPDFSKEKENLVSDLQKCVGAKEETGLIFHLDVGAMYPNIILTNRLQPISIVNDDICMRCSYNSEETCKRRLSWISRAEIYFPNQAEVTNIVENLKKELFYVFDKKEEKKVPFSDLPKNRQENILKERVEIYSKAVYKKTKRKEEKTQNVTVCQKEIPFYVDTVKLFRDTRYKYKSKYKKALVEFEKNPTKKNKESMFIFNSLQIAYKTVLNSFYGYVMRKGSRWWSIDMAAITCRIGGEIIKLAKRLIDGIGIPLELDTDGIWAIFPKSFPTEISISGKKVNVINVILNFLVCRNFTNDQYQDKNPKTGNYEVRTENSIYFETDGPYKTMIIPSSIEENRMLKKRYVVFDFENQIAELKGFELKRRGELNFVKRFQEDIFTKFNTGKNLNECYENLAEVCNYWLDIIDTEGRNLDDETIFDLFSESKNMSKDLSEYASKKSNIRSTAIKLSEFLGKEVLEEKLKCDFIVSKYPESASTADRVIPTLIFKFSECDKFLKKWIGVRKSYKVKDLLDWQYYRKRFEFILQRLVIVPAHFQGIQNPLKRVENLKWTGDPTAQFSKRIVDLEEAAIDTTVFIKKHKKEVQKIDEICTKKVEPKNIQNQEEIKTDLLIPEEFETIKKFVEVSSAAWRNFYGKKCRKVKSVYAVTFHANKLKFCFFSGKFLEKEFMHKVYLDVNETKFFSHLPVEEKFVGNSKKKFYVLSATESELEKFKSENFFDHFSIKNWFMAPNPLYQTVAENTFETESLPVIIVSSIFYQKKPIFCASVNDKMYKITELKTVEADFVNLKSFFASLEKSRKFLLCNRKDQFIDKIRENSTNFILIELNQPIPITLESLETLIKKQRTAHNTMKDEYLMKLELADFTEMPLLNIHSEDVLDFFYYKKLYKANVLITENKEEKASPLSVFREEKKKSGFYGSFSAQIELSGALLAAIIDFECFLCNKKYEGVKTKEFCVFREFLGEILLKSAEKNSGASFMLNKLNEWIKKDSKIVSKKIQETVKILQNQFLVYLYRKLKSMQFIIFGISKEILFINTTKNNKKDCEEFLSYFHHQIKTIEGCELINCTILRVFEKIGFIDPSTYFFMIDSSFYSSVDNLKIPEIFLEKYFSEEAIENSFIYDVVPSTDLISAKMMLRLFSYKKDTHGIVSNCYKLMRVSEFGEEKDIKLNLSIFCATCGCENFVRKNCIKCHSTIDQVLIEEECEKYLNYCWYQQIEGDRFCAICNSIEERKLRDFCACGGKYEYKNYLKEFEDIKSFVGTESFSEKVENVFNYLNGI
ncbi:DNA polymerase [Nucleospora cyclopteri]